jgi:flagellar basal-body rod protein FlgC
VPIFRADSLDGSFQADLDDQQRLYGVRVEKVVNAQREPILVYNPDHPDANEEGFVAMPNINIVEETTDMLNAARSYEANLAVLTTAKSMVRSALDLGKA